MELSWGLNKVVISRLLIFKNNESEDECRDDIGKMECHAGRGSKNLKWEVSDKGVALPTKIQQKIMDISKSSLTYSEILFESYCCHSS